MGRLMKLTALPPLTSMEWHYGRLCAVLVLTILLGLPLREAGQGRLLFALLVAALIYAAACAAGDTKSLRKIYAALVTPSILIDLKIIMLGSGDALAMVGGVFQVLFLGFTCGAILFHIVKRERLTMDTILGGVCAYLLVGEIFAFFFGMIEMIRPGSFLEGGHMLKEPPNANHLLGRRPELTYFSFITLTTLGYGDIVPVAPIARVVAVLEALVGQIFLATFLAFLVGNYLAQRQDDRQRLSGM
jgi:hypothetical protein